MCVVVTTLSRTYCPVMGVGIWIGLYCIYSISIIGFGRKMLSSLILEPKPPANNTTFISLFSLRMYTYICAQQIWAQRYKKKLTYTNVYAKFLQISSFCRPKAQKSTKSTQRKVDLMNIIQPLHPSKDSSGCHLIILLFKIRQICCHRHWCYGQIKPKASNDQ